jgi:putative hemolysin
MKGEQQDKSYQPIDLREVVGNKNPKLAKRIPKFIYNWLNRLLHVEEINDFLSKNSHLSGLDFLEEGTKFLQISYKVIGEENIPPRGRYFFASNHPLGGLDGMILLKIINEKTESKARALANDFLMTIKPMHEYFVPINKVGGQARESVRAIEDLYESPDQIMMFPAGLCSRKQNGRIMDLTWQKHFIQRAKQYKMGVVPVYFEGRNTNRFYNLARLRKFLGIKFNFEMITLVDEMFKQKNKTFTIYIGKAMPPETFNNSKKPAEWAEYVKQIAYSLPQKST